MIFVPLTESSPWQEVLEEAEVAEIRKLHAGGEELEKIAQRFGITGSAVSRICVGNRHGR